MGHILALLHSPTYNLTPTDHLDKVEMALRKCGSSLSAVGENEGYNYDKLN